MARKMIQRNLINNAIQAYFAAVEIHNKPKIEYRYETTSMLIINAWELILKAFVRKYIKNKNIFKPKDKNNPNQEQETLPLKVINSYCLEYLNSIGLGVAFDMDMSIYDLAQNLCSSKKVVLKEHFRCLPEIIEFSNQYFYGGQINCLKVRSKENTTKDPIKTYYLESATVNDESSNYLVNTSEVDKIIEILKEIENDQTYINKDIGVIVLQNSSAKIKAINTAIWQNFSSDFIKNRRIKIGNSYEFQGDERDVIILSMVISKKMENGDTRIVKALTTKEYERSFNVAASRAKEQVILVHSIAANELSKECLRYKLITYYNTFNNNKKESDKINLVTEFEKSIYNELKLKNISIIPHFKIGKYDVDFVVNDQNGKKIGIEFDGDIPYTREEFENEITKQDVLTRCGWKFIRVRASMYYSNKEDTLNQIIKKIHYIINE